jgi:predicted ATPase with chaperone activity
VGTSRLARRLTTILPAMALAEAIEMTCIPSLACHVIAIKFPGLA